MVRLVALVIVVVVGIALVQLVAPWIRRAGRRVTGSRPGSVRRGGYEWNRRRDQLVRRAKGVPGPSEHREEILAFLDTHRGVEAYVEPKTVMHPLSVVLVDGEGVAARFELKEDAILRELSRTRGLPVLDASRVGYPERMRRPRPKDDPRPGG
jgi:hypothetical protein